MEENGAERSITHARSTALVRVQPVDRAPEGVRHLPGWARGYLPREHAYRRALAGRYEYSGSPWHLD